jgi:hypothetical protein
MLSDRADIAVIPWKEFFKALKKIGYEGPTAI